MQSSNVSCTACDKIFCFTDARTFLVLPDAWVAAAAAVAESAFCGEGVFAVVASSLALVLLLLLLIPPEGRASEGIATGDETGGGTGASCLLPPEERGVDVLAQPPLPGGIIVRDFGFLHPYTSTPVNYVITFYTLQLCENQTALQYHYYYYWVHNQLQRTESSLRNWQLFSCSRYHQGGSPYPYCHHIGQCSSHL